MSSVADLDRAHVWHPFTAMADWCGREPLVIDRAEGNWLISADGRRYLDGVASLWCNVHGHRRREIDDAIRAQLERVAHSTLLGLTHAPAAALAARLVALAPAGLTRVFYSDSGSTAVEVALKLAFQFWRHRGRAEKRAFAALTDAYHGDTLGSVAVGGIDLFHAAFGPLLFPVHRVAPDRDAAALAALLADRAGELAALVVEPLVQGAAGMIVQPPGFLRRAAELCREHEVLLIADEVATGFGRTGRMFACEHEGVAPDLLCLAKGLTGGYLPLAATLATERVYDAFLAAPHEGRQFFHGHTYTGNPLACAAALASLDVFAREPVLERVRDRAARLAARLATRVAPIRHVRAIRQVGLMVGIDLGAHPPERRVGFHVCLAARDHGVILRPLGEVIVLMPPLSIGEDELDLLADAAAAGIAAVLGP